MPSMPQAYRVVPRLVAAAGDGDVGALPAVVVDAVTVEAALLASSTEAAGRRYKKGRNDSKRYCDG